VAPMPHRESPPAANRGASTTTGREVDTKNSSLYRRQDGYTAPTVEDRGVSQAIGPGGGRVSDYSEASQQVCWSEVRAFVLLKLDLVGDWPMVGSPAWCLLDDRDRVKWASLLDAAQHWALRVEYFQQVQCDASHEISAAFDWARWSRIRQTHGEWHAARPWLKRVSR